MVNTLIAGKALRGAIIGGLAVSSFYEKFLASSARKEKLRRKLKRRETLGLEKEPTEALKIRAEVKRLSDEANAVDRDIARFMADQAQSNPLNQNRKTVFLVVTSGQAVRGFLLTDVIRRLTDRFNVVILTQYAYDADFMREHAGPNVHVLPWFSKFKSRFTNVFQYHLIQTSGSSTHQGWLSNLDQRAKSADKDDPRRFKRFRHHIRLRQISNLLGSVVGARGLIGLYHAYLMSYIPQSMLRRLFDTYRPVLVVSTTAHHTAAWPVSYFARQRGVTTLAYVLSWDNCTTKATLDPYAEHCAVWSEEMKGEVARYFPYLPGKTIVAGAPIFDMYSRDELLTPRESFLRDLGLRPEFPLVFYATNTPAAMPDEPKLIERFWKELSQTPYGGRVSLLVRLHPADRAERYEALRGRENVVVIVANESGGDSEDALDAWIPDRDAMSLLLNSVKHAAVSINVASTMSLESFAAGIPTLNVAFRADRAVREKFLWNFDMYHTSEHYRALVENGAVGIARSMEDLVAQTVQVLDGNNSRGPAMQATLAQKVDYREGASTARVLEIIEELAGEQSRAAFDVQHPLPVSNTSSDLRRRAPGAQQGMATTRLAPMNGWGKQFLVEMIWFFLRVFTIVTLAVSALGARLLNVVRRVLGRPTPRTATVRSRGAENVGAEAAPVTPLEAASSIDVPEDTAVTVVEPRSVVAGAELVPRLAGDRFAELPAQNPIISALRAIGSYAEEVKRSRKAAHRIGRDIEEGTTRAGMKLDPARPTVFLIITCGQAIRNFLLSDFYSLMAARYNLVILSPYAYSDAFRSAYQRENVHVLPWFTRYKPRFERLFLYYLMKESGSGTHRGWLKNLEVRAKGSKTSRYAKQHKMSRASCMLGRVLGRKGLLALYQSYMVAILPKSMFTFLFEHYQPALVISTAVHHSETWPLTYHAQRYGVKTLGTVLSWDNTTTKPAIDPACGVCGVWSEEMSGEVARHFPYLNVQTRVTGSPLFDMYYNRRLGSDRSSFLSSLGLSPELPYVLYTTNTPAATLDEHVIVHQFWKALSASRFGGKVSLLIRLHPKQKWNPYAPFARMKDVALTRAGTPVWNASDRWIPDEGDMRLLLNSMMHAAVSVNIASTMSLESFALGLPTINVALKSSEHVKDATLMWSFDMFHTSDHYKAIVENGAVDVARSIDELVAMTIDAIENGTRRQAAMRRTLEQKAAYADGTSAQRLFEVVEGMLEQSRVPEATVVNSETRRAIVSTMQHDLPTGLAPSSAPYSVAAE